MSTWSEPDRVRSPWRDPTVAGPRAACHPDRPVTPGACPSTFVLSVPETRAPDSTPTNADEYGDRHDDPYRHADELSDRHSDANAHGRAEPLADQYPG